MSKSKTAPAIVAAAQERQQTRTKLRICFLLVLGGLLLTTGCATVVYKADFNTEKRPQMSLPGAYQNIKSALQKLFCYNPEDIQVTNEGFSFKNLQSCVPAGEYAARFDEMQNPRVLTSPLNGYYVDVNPSSMQGYTKLWWVSLNDAQRFVDAVQAMKYYTSKQYLADEAIAFSEFQQKVKVWHALSPKPPLSEEVRRFRVQADDALQRKDFEGAANYYEQGLVIEPMWPAGQFNAAIIYGELKLYSMAVIHMKRYLELNPDAKDAKAYRDQMYIWEEKANEADASSQSSLDRFVQF